MQTSEIKNLLQPYMLANCLPPDGLYEKLSLYLDLLMKWNARTNLTAIRDPAEIVRRHFGESLFAAQHIHGCETLLDFGSGAGFPGLPIQLMHPELKVSLAESQNKKAVFLQEAVRTLSLKTEVWAGRVETMPAARQFDVVTLRAVDDMAGAVAAASHRAARQVMLLTTTLMDPFSIARFSSSPELPIPGTQRQTLLILERNGVGEDQ